MNKEQFYFLSALADHINERESCFKEDLDWVLLNEYANRQSLSPIVYFQCKSIFPLVKQLQATYASQIYQSVNKKVTLADIKNQLQDIQYIVLKGLCVAELYPVPELRTMGDIDILIHEEDRQVVHDRLLNDGFEFVKAFYTEWTYRRKDTVVEVHTSLIYDEKGQEHLKEYFDGVWNHVCNNVLDWNYHLLFLIQHLRKHFVSENVGFRQFMDIAIVSKLKSLNWNLITNELDRINLLPFAKAVYTLNYLWFDVENPLEMVPLKKSFFEEVTEKMFEDGLFNHPVEKENVVSISRIMHYQGKSSRNAKISYIIRALFPKYEIMAQLSYCSYLKEKRFLLPCAWIQRGMHCIVDKRRRSIMKDIINTSINEIEEKTDILKALGL